jgi:acid phosphatase family membrane protein YuiD
MYMVAMAGPGVDMDLSYVLTPFCAWIIAGAIKFLVNSIKTKKLAFELIGYGGLPSNHSAIVSSTAALIALKEGVSHPAFGVAITLAFIVMLDASSLRKKIEDQARAINILGVDCGHDFNLRERIGHTAVEMLVGMLVGVAAAILVFSVFPH